MEPFQFNGVQDKQAKVLEMRLEGYNLAEIATACGYASASGVSAVINRHLNGVAPVIELTQEYRKRLLEESQEERDLFRTMLDDIKAEPDASKRLDMLVKYSKAVADLRKEEAKLTGAYAPEKIEQSVSISQEEALKELE